MSGRTQWRSCGSLSLAEGERAGVGETAASRKVLMSPLPMNLAQKAGSELHALQTPPRRFNVPETREAFGVRPACCRFWFMVPMRGCKTVAAFHEPKGRAGCPHPAAGHAGHIGRPRRRGDTQLYPPLAVQGFKARSFVSESSRRDSLPFRRGEGNHCVRLLPIPRSLQYVVLVLRPSSSNLRS